MWIKTITGDAINMDFAVKIESVEITATEYEVAVFADDGYDTVAIFDNEDAAKKCVEELVNVLNGGKVGYSFSWLTKSEPAPAAVELYIEACIALDLKDKENMAQVLEKILDRWNEIFEVGEEDD